MKRAFLASAAALLLAIPAFAAFTDMDTDSDGALSPSEFVTAFPDASEQDFQAADANADGVISEPEHVAAVEAGILPAE